MKQFPFAHTIDMTHRIRDGVLEVDTRIDNLSVAPMPVAIGFHPFFQLTDSPRDEWTLSVAARTHWPVSDAKMPTGVPQPIEKFFANPAAVQLAPIELDDVFSDLIRDPNGEATMSVRGRTQRLDVVFGANYRAVVIYAPKPAAGQDAAARNFVCIEPVTAIINGLNLAHKGFYKELQSIAPGGSWQERFRIRPSGF
jgi:aldose 1-epimerase